MMKQPQHQQQDNMDENNSNCESQQLCSEEGEQNNTNGDDESTLSRQQRRRRRGQCLAQLTARLANFSTSYNVVNISLVIPILKILYGGTEEQVAASASSLLAGMIFGQILGGAMGDFPSLGRLGALRLVMVMQIVTSLGSAIFVRFPYVYTPLAIWRFILGMSAGAVYPLAATLSAEASTRQVDFQNDNNSNNDKVQNVVLTFATQGLGFLTVPLLAVPLLYTVSNLDLIWRLLLAFGSVPGIILMILQCQLYSNQQRQLIEPLSQSAQEEAEDGDQRNSNQGQESGERARQDGIDSIEEQDGIILTTNTISNDDHDGENGTNNNVGIWASIRKEPNIVQKLLGTAGTWFLFDVLFYGNTLFQPIVMDAAFGHQAVDEDEKLRREAINSLILACIALPGYIVSALVMGKRILYIFWTPRLVQMQGFAIMGLLYAFIAAYWTPLTKLPALLVIVYGLTFFFANFGPNTTTFILPSLIYSQECRSTLNGVSAAAGKLGALLGATMFEPARSWLGSSAVMLICASVSIVAFALTRLCVQPPRNNDTATGRLMTESV